MLIASESRPTYQKTVVSEIASLERKVELLIQQQKAAQAEVQQLRAENARLQESISQRDQQIDHFQKTIKINKIANHTVADKSETTELKRTINEYIKKIDKCIAQLSQ